MCYPCSPSSSSAFDPTKALIILAPAKKASGTGLKINGICNFYTMKSVVELLLVLIYSTIIKILLLC